ncbi:hypothetical protein KR084_003344 [Drosophila pseudotakahashii]|nr:hypothetical protein KR084_003344 [Drosophila pseudotakahashii]
MCEGSYSKDYITMRTKDRPLEIMKERDNLLQQLQNELAKNEALRQQIAEQEQSNQAIVDLREAEHRSLVEEVQQLKKKLQEIEDGNLCCICLMPWNPVGDHRLVTLRCGHLFGESCVTKYSSDSSECPTCHKSGTARLNKIRIFGCHVLAAPQT